MLNWDTNDQKELAPNNTIKNNNWENSDEFVEVGSR